MKTLDQIAIGFQTDKATQFSRTYAKPHAYTPHYERVFEPLRFSQIKFLEIGVGGGESIRTWLEYFSQGQIYGVDIVHDDNPWNTPKANTHQRYQFCQGDQSCSTFWACFIADFGPDWDVIIDDGSHIAEHIITTFMCLWPFVKPNGIYAIEDLNEAPGANDWIKGQILGIHIGHGDIESITFSKELAIIRKKG